MIPNLKKAAVEAKDLSELTIACVNCKSPLWKLSDRLEYGTRVSYTETAYPGVKEYKEVWQKDGNGGYKVVNEDLLCPFCSEPFMKAVQAQGHVFPVPFVLELQ